MGLALRSGQVRALETHVYIKVCMILTQMSRVFLRVDENEAVRTLNLAHLKDISHPLDGA